MEPASQKFEMEKWLFFYRQVYVAAKDKDEVLVKKLLEQTTKYLNNCGKFPRKPLYPYDPKDRTTWKYTPTKSMKPGEWAMLNPGWKYKEIALKRGHY